MISLSSGFPGSIGSSLSPPLRKFSKVVMSSLPLRFLESWQAKQFSLRIGATSLIKLTGPFFGAAAAEKAFGAANNMPRARARPPRGQKTHQLKRDRNMELQTPGKDIANGNLQFSLMVKK